MKTKTEMFFFSATSDKVATFEAYKNVPVETVQILNTYKLKDEYPASFFYLKAKIKGVIKYYAGCVAKPGQWDDPEFTKMIEPDYEPNPIKDAPTRNNFKG